jgi:phage FluMu gp28-like protein
MKFKTEIVFDGDRFTCGKLETLDDGEYTTAHSGSSYLRILKDGIAIGTLCSNPSVAGAKDGDMCLNFSIHEKAEEWYQEQKKKNEAT